MLKKYSVSVHVFMKIVELESMSLLTNSEIIALDLPGSTLRIPDIVSVFRKYPVV